MTVVVQGTPVVCQSIMTPEDLQVTINQEIKINQTSRTSCTVDSSDRDAPEVPALSKGFQRCSCCHAPRRRVSGCSCRGGKSHQCQKGFVGVGEPPDIPPNQIKATQSGMGKSKEIKATQPQEIKGTLDQEIKVTLDIKVKAK